jgi:hypothetical protein
MNIRIVPIAEEHIAEFHRVLDVVARERKYLAFLKAPPLEAARVFILNNIAKNNVQLVALSADELVGWSDIFAEGPSDPRACGCIGHRPFASIPRQRLGSGPHAGGASGSFKLRIRSHRADRPRR